MSSACRTMEPPQEDTAMSQIAQRPKPPCVNVVRVKVQILVAISASEGDGQVDVMCSDSHRYGDRRTFAMSGRK